MAMENLHFGIDKNQQLNEVGHGNSRCQHCDSPAQYIVQPDNQDDAESIQVCGICAAYYRMNELGEDDKIIFVDELQAKWISHLQRAIQAAKDSGDEHKLKEAQKLERWLFAHAKFVDESQWKTDSPVPFDAVIERATPGLRKQVFSELAIALSEATLQKSFDLESYEKPPINSWKDHLKQFKKLSISKNTEEGE